MKRKNYFPKATSQDNNRTVYFKMRVTQEEYDFIKKHSGSFHEISNYIRSALAEYSNPMGKEAIDFMYDLLRFHFEYGDDISWYGYGLNQSVKRINELAKAGKLTFNDIVHGPLYSIKSLHDDMTTVKAELEAVIESATERDSDKMTTIRNQIYIYGQENEMFATAANEKGGRKAQGYGEKP